MCFPKEGCVSVKRAAWRMAAVMPIDVKTYPGSK